jgi:hypothetical protein
VLQSQSPEELHHFGGAGGALARCGSGYDGSCFSNDGQRKNDVLKQHQHKHLSM